MNASESDLIYFFDHDDPEMQRAYEQARTTFRFFWRETAWEQRRAIPILDLACVKAPFSNADGKQAEDHPEAEQMWVSDVGFDGNQISGTLINSPQWVTSVSEGDTVRLSITEITDWMYVIQDRVYGAYTVNLLRARMTPDEREQHDAAWDLDFGDPNTIDVIPGEDGNDGDADHPMGQNMSESLEDYLNENPGQVDETDDNGWTLLHQLALAGSTSCVALLLKHGADPNRVTRHGMTPLQLANSLQWKSASQLLAASGAD